MSESAGNWCLIESDPGVFTELIRGFGVKGVQVEELYSLDDSSFEELRPVHGLIFLFKWRAGEETSGELAPDASVFFAQQEFRSFTTGFDPASRGLCLSNSDEIRKVHNSFAREHYFEVGFGKASKDDNFHFVTYVPINGQIYELDGLRSAPVLVGTVKEGDDWLNVVRPIINQRIEKYSAGEIHFNLMSVISDRKTKSEKRIAELTEAGMDSDEIAAEICRLQNVIAEEEDKTRRYKLENARRRHNYTPFIVELLKVLAKEKKLVPLVEKAIEDSEKKRQKKQDAPKV
ncbi:ubiquitin carboxyl-terminal hydrolase, family 1 domain-containing protein [Ditylenchus destructor]|nr:ubiquitin carboxyl-terminal hydrolase, family 1 domain-containing protein [Ditylenchus destructor]